MLRESEDGPLFQFERNIVQIRSEKIEVEIQNGRTPLVEPSGFKTRNCRAQFFLPFDLRHVTYEPASKGGFNVISDFGFIIHEFFDVSRVSRARKVEFERIRPKVAVHVDVDEAESFGQSPRSE